MHYIKTENSTVTLCLSYSWNFASMSLPLWEANATTAYVYLENKDLYLWRIDMVGFRWWKTMFVDKLYKIQYSFLREQILQNASKSGETTVVLWCFPVFWWAQHPSLGMLLTAVSWQSLFDTDFQVLTRHHWTWVFPTGYPGIFLMERLSCCLCIFCLFIIKKIIRVLINWRKEIIVVSMNLWKIYLWD